MGLSESLQLLERYSVVILPALVIAEQVGVPLPAVPALLAVGALAASGRASIPLVLGAIAVVALTVDLGWYELGRRRGVGVLARLCRLSLEPDWCVRRTENVFARYGVRGMLIAKFVPGLTTGTGSGTPPPNAAGGLIGVESGVVGTSGLGFTSTIICFSNLPEKIASAVDGQIDDSKPASGQVRAQLQSTANPATLAASNVTAYVETGVNQYLLCKNF